MIDLTTILLLVWVHYVADYLLQSRGMGENKSSSNLWLVYHVVVYSLPLIFFGFLFAVVNGVLHFATDYVTSRLTKKYWSIGEDYKTFAVMGADQAIHVTCLFATYGWLVK